MSQISYNDVLGVYMMTFVWVSLEDNPPQAAWFFSTATSLDDQDWTPPQMIENSQFRVIEACGSDGSGNKFDGWYPSFMSPESAAGHISRSGRVFFMTGCDTGPRTFMSRRFTITGPPLILPKSLDAGVTDFTGTFIPVRLNKMLVGLFWFVGLWAMERLAEAGPATVGEHRTVTVTDCPGAKLNVLPSLATEKEAARVPTLPVNTAVDDFVIVDLQNGVSAKIGGVFNRLLEDSFLYC